MRPAHHRGRFSRSSYIALLPYRIAGKDVPNPSGNMLGSELLLND